MGKVGDISNDDDKYNICVEKFARREKALQTEGYETINPMRIVTRGKDWNEAMRICITIMLECDCVSPLPDTWYSVGGMIEFELSQRLKMPIVMPKSEEDIKL